MRDDELISASFDGELIPSEQKITAEKIQSDPNFQQEQKEIARVSEAIKGLPRKAAPPELLASVRQQVERESLLAEMPVKRPPNSVPKPSGSTGIGLKTILITVACCVLALISVPWFWQSQSKQSQAPEMAALEQTSSSLSVKAGKEINLEKTYGYSTDRDEDGVFASRSNGFVPTPELNKLKTTTAPAESVVTSNGTELKMQDSLVEMEIGSTFDAKEVSGNQVSVVRLTVVDRVSSLQDFQVLLQKHNINPESNTSSKGTVASSESVPRDGYKFEVAEAAEENDSASNDAESGLDADSGLIAVYVSAPQDQLDAALAELKSAAFVEEEDFFLGTNETILSDNDNSSTSWALSNTELFGVTKELSDKILEEEKVSDAPSGSIPKQIASAAVPEKAPANIEKESSKQKADFEGVKPPALKVLAKSTSENESENLTEKNEVEGVAAPISGVQVTFQIPEQKLEILLREQEALRAMALQNKPQSMASMSNTIGNSPEPGGPPLGDKKVAGSGGSQPEKVARYRVKDNPDRVRQHIIQKEADEGVLLYSRPVQKTAQVLFIIRTKNSRTPVPAEKPGKGDSSSLRPWGWEPIWGDRQRLIG